VNPLRKVEPFKSYLELFKSEATREGYASDLDVFRKWLDDRGKGILDATQDDCHAWVIWCQGRELKDRTITRKIAAIHGFYKRLLRRKQITSDPTIEFEEFDFDAAKRNPKPLTDEQRATLLSSLKWTPFRNWKISMFALIGYYTGMRRNEIRKIKWADINFETMKIQTIGKGAKPLTKHFNKELADKLNQYKQVIMSRELKRDGETIQPFKELPPYLFFNPFKPSVPVGNWNVSKWSFKIKQWCGWDESVHFTWHRLRHTFINILMENDVPIEVTQELAGHSNIATTTMYYRARMEKQDQAYKSAMEPKK